MEGGTSPFPINLGEWLAGERAKLSSAGFNKFMDQRGIGEEARSNLSNSFAKGSDMQIRYVQVKEQFITTHGEKIWYFCDRTGIG